MVSPSSWLVNLPFHRSVGSYGRILISFPLFLLLWFSLWPIVFFCPGCISQSCQKSARGLGCSKLLVSFLVTGGLPIVIESPSTSWRAEPWDIRYVHNNWQTYTPLPPSFPDLVLNCKISLPLQSRGDLHPAQKWGQDAFYIWTPSLANMDGSFDSPELPSSKVRGALATHTHTHHLPFLAFLCCELLLILLIYEGRLREVQQQAKDSCLTAQSIACWISAFLIMGWLERREAVAFKEKGERLNNIFCIPLTELMWLCC